MTPGHVDVNVFSRLVGVNSLAGWISQFGFQSRSFNPNLLFYRFRAIYLEHGIDDTYTPILLTAPKKSRACCVTSPPYDLLSYRLLQCVGYRLLNYLKLNINFFRTCFQS